MEWSNEKVLALIDSYQNYPVLWDSKHPNHKERNARKDAYSELASEFKYSKDNIEQKINKLRGQFQREFLKVKKSKKSGSSNDSVYTPKWFTYKAMMGFMGAQDDSDSTISNLLVEVDETWFELNTDDICSVTTENEFAIMGEIGEHAEGSNASSNQNEPERNKKQSVDEMMSEAYSALQRVVQAPEIPEDNFSIYGCYVANEVRQFQNSPHLLACVKFEIKNILFKTSTGRLNDSNTIVSDVASDFSI